MIVKKGESVGVTVRDRSTGWTRVFTFRSDGTGIDYGESSNYNYWYGNIHPYRIWGLSDVLDIY